MVLIAAVLDRAVRLAQQQLVLVAVGRGRVVVDRAGAGDRRDRRAALTSWSARPLYGRDVAELELAVGGRERVGLQRVRAVGVALDHLGERVALELGAQVHAGRAGQVVEPVTVLQVLQLRLEDVVEGAAQQAAEQVGHLGEATDPQVDVVEAGGGHAVGVARPGAGAEHEVGGVGRLDVGRDVGVPRIVAAAAGSTIARAASRLPSSVVALVMRRVRCRRPPRS